MGRSLELLADHVEGKLANAEALLSLRQSILKRVAEQAGEVVGLSRLGGRFTTCAK